MTNKENKPKSTDRFLSRILDAASNHWYEVVRDYTNHTARGLLEIEHLGVHQMTLMIDTKRWRVTLTGGFKRTSSPISTTALHSLQARLARSLANVMPDPENNLFMVWANTTTESQSVENAVRSIFHDTSEILADRDFQHLLAN